MDIAIKKNDLDTLLSILEGNDNAIKNICKSLINRGYAFIILPDFLIKEIDNLMVIINNFFDKELEYKTPFFKKPMFGYFDVGHKESFRLFTGSRIQENIYPYQFDKIQNFAQYIDKIMYSLSLLLSPYIFPNLINKSKELDIPFFNGSQSWAMFDITKYYNDGSRKEINCLEHYDPGLLSLSLRSTEPGLQLKNEHGNWINAPTNKNIAMLWAGNAATQINPKIKPGIHRVINPVADPLNNVIKKNPRIAIWYEICASYQEHKELLNDKTEKARKLEDLTGIPMSKSGIPMSKKSYPSSLGTLPRKQKSDSFLNYNSFSSPMFGPFDNNKSYFSEFDNQNLLYKSHRPFDLLLKQSR